MKNSRPRPAATRAGSPGHRERAWLLLVTGWLACAVTASAATSATQGADVASQRPGNCRAGSPIPYAQPTFLGYACRDRDCSAHKAGFAWAERNGVTDVRECAASPNPAFVEGCRTFAEEAVTPEQAGFEWARENELDEACRCRGGGAGFEAGCTAYVGEVQH